MARRCELTGKGTLVGNNVSHANNKTKRIYRPNLQTIDLVSEALGNSYKLKIAMNTLRSVDKVGGLDAFLAQLIAASIHDGPGSALERFAGTGILDAEAALAELNDVTVPIEREPWLDALGRYIITAGKRS